MEGGWLGDERGAGTWQAAGFMGGGRPDGEGEPPLMRTAILPGMHLNPSDFRS